MKKVIIILGAVALVLTLCIISVCNRKVIDFYTGTGAPDNMTYKSASYVFDWSATKYWGKSTRGVNVYAIKGDMENNFLIEWGDNTDCYMKEGYEIPTSGTVTAVFAYGKKLTEKQNEIDAFIEIAKNEGEKYTVSTKNVQHDAKDFFFAYEGCPVAIFEGYIAYIDGKWFFITRLDYSNFTASLDFLNPENRSTYKGAASLIADETIIKILEKNRNLRKLRPTSFLSENTYCKSQAIPQCQDNR
jgi:hypothetical protein